MLYHDCTLVPWLACIVAATGHIDVHWFRQVDATLPIALTWMSLPSYRAKKPRVDNSNPDVKASFFLQLMGYMI